MLSQLVKATGDISQYMLKGQIIELMKDPEFKIAAKNFVLDLAKNEEIYKQVVDKLSTAASDPKLKGKAMEFMEDLSGNKQVQRNVMETLSTAAKQSFKKNLPKCAYGASVGVGSVIAGMAVLKTLCRPRLIPEPPENQPW